MLKGKHGKKSSRKKYAVDFQGFLSPATRLATVSGSYGELQILCEWRSGAHSQYSVVFLLGALLASAVPKLHRLPYCWEGLWRLFRKLNFFILNTYADFNAEFSELCSALTGLSWMSAAVGSVWDGVVPSSSGSAPL